MANKSTDAFQGANAPAVSAVTVVPDTPLAKMSRGLWVGGAGDVSAVMADGNTVVFKGVAAGTWLEIQVQMVNSASTATFMLALY